MPHFVEHHDDGTIKYLDDNGEQKKINDGDILYSRTVGKVIFREVTDFTDGNTIVTFEYSDGSELTSFFDTVSSAMFRHNLEHERQSEKHIASW